jgi:hypothetical protein
MNEPELLECLWYFWTQKGQPLITGNDIEAWSNNPFDRNNKPLPKVHLDTRRYEAWTASIEAQTKDDIVRWKEGPDRNKRVWYSLSQNTCGGAYLAAKQQAKPSWIEHQIP